MKQKIVKSLQFLHLLDKNFDYFESNHKYFQTFDLKLCHFERQTIHWWQRWPQWWAHRWLHNITIRSKECNQWVSVSCNWVNILISQLVWCIAGLFPMQMMPPMPPMGVTVPSGVTTISAPPVRNITLSSSQNPNQGQPSLLGVYPGANPVRPSFSVFIRTSLNWMQFFSFN